MKIKTKFSMIAMAAMLMMQGCGAKQENYDRLLDPNKPITLEIWTYYNGTQKAAFDGLVTEFNETVGAEKGIVVEAYSQGNVNDLIQKVEESAEKKVGAGAFSKASLSQLSNKTDKQKRLRYTCTTAFISCFSVRAFCTRLHHAPDCSECDPIPCDPAPAASLKFPSAVSCASVFSGGDASPFFGASSLY